MVFAAICLFFYPIIAKLFILFEEWMVKKAVKTRRIERHNIRKHFKGAKQINDDIT